MTSELISISPLSVANEVRYYIEQALSAATLRAYRDDIAQFVAWGGKVPCGSDMVISYLAAHAGIHSIATLQRRLVSIAKAHTTQGMPDPVKNDQVRLTFRGIRRVHGVPQRQVAPVLRDDLLLMLSHTPDNAKGMRDRALLMLGFCAALRRSELIAVTIQDLEFTSNGIVLTLPRSKTDQIGLGRNIGIPKGRGRVCPVKTIEDWLVHLSANSESVHSGANNGPVFRSITKGGIISTTGLSGKAVADIVKHYAKKAGFDPTRYSSHGLRAGLATSAAQAGIPSWAIMKTTGHRSQDMLARYVRDGELFRNNAADLF